MNKGVSPIITLKKTSHLKVFIVLALTFSFLISQAPAAFAAEKAL